MPVDELAQWGSAAPSWWPAAQRWLPLVTVVTILVAVGVALPTKQRVDPELRARRIAVALNFARFPASLVCADRSRLDPRLVRASRDASTVIVEVISVGGHLRLRIHPTDTQISYSEIESVGTCTS